MVSCIFYSLFPSSQTNQNSYPTAFYFSLSFQVATPYLFFTVYLENLYPFSSSVSPLHKPIPIFFYPVSFPFPFSSFFFFSSSASLLFVFFFISFSLYFIAFYPFLFFISNLLFSLRLHQNTACFAMSLSVHRFLFNTYIDFLIS